MTAYSDPPPQSRRAARMSERGEAPQTPQETPSETGDAGFEPLTYVTQGRVQLPDFVPPHGAHAAPSQGDQDAAAGQSDATPGEQRLQPPPGQEWEREPLATQPPPDAQQGFRVRDFSPEGRRAALSREQFGSIAGAAGPSLPPPTVGTPAPAGGDLDYQTQGVRLGSHAAPPSNVDDSLMNHTLTRRELREMRAAQEAAAPPPPLQLPESIDTLLNSGPIQLPTLAPEPGQSQAFTDALAEYDALAQARRASEQRARDEQVASLATPIAPAPAAPAPEAEATPEVVAPAAVPPFSAAPVQPFGVGTVLPAAPPTSDATAAPDGGEAVGEPDEVADAPAPVDQAPVVDLPAPVDAAGETSEPAEASPFADLIAPPPTTAPVTSVPAPPSATFPAASEPSASPFGLGGAFSPDWGAADRETRGEPVTQVQPTPPPVTPPQPVAPPQAATPELVEPQANTVDPVFLEPRQSPDTRPSNHWSLQAERADDDLSFEGGSARAVGTANSAITTSALVLPSVPTAGDLTGPLTATGEILVTGSIELPHSVSSTGAHPLRVDNSDYEDDPLDSQVSTPDSAPVRAIRAVSTHTSTRGVIESKRPQGNRGLTAIIAVAAVLVVVVVGILVFALVTNKL